MGIKSVPAAEKEQSMGSTVTVTQAESEHPEIVVTVTQYRVVNVGVTVMIAAVSPLFHKYPPPPDAPSVVLCPDVMVILLYAVTFGMGFTTTDALAVSAQLPMETITE